MAGKHTPGPWRLFLTTDGRALIGIGEETGEGITDRGFGTWRSGEEQIANARLIAAAPDLLEALKNLVAIYDDEFGIVAPEMDAARAALSKADPDV